MAAGPGASGLPTTGAHGAFAGLDPTFSDPLPLAIGTTTTRGGFTQSGGTVRASTPPGQPAGTYTGTLQYTITTTP